MSDQRLRELERRWKETGAVEDEANYLMARVRQGQLSSNRMDLCGYLGHPAALLALGDRAPQAPGPEAVSLCGPHAMSAAMGNNTFCGTKATGPEVKAAHTGIPTCRRCLGSSRWRAHAKTAIKRWVETLVADYGLAAGRVVAITTVRAVLAWCETQNRRTLPFQTWQGLFQPTGSSGPLPGLEQAKDELRQLQTSLAEAESPDDPMEEAKRIIRIVDGATMMGWDELREAIRDGVAPWALYSEPPVAA